MDAVSDAVVRRVVSVANLYSVSAGLSASKKIILPWRKAFLYVSGALKVVNDDW